MKPEKLDQGMDRYFPPFKTMIWIFVVAVLGIPVGILLAPGSQHLQYGTLGFLTFLYISFMFQRTPNVSPKSSFSGWFLGGICLGLAAGLVNQSRFLAILQSIPRFAMIGILFAFVDNITRPWRLKE